MLILWSFTHLSIQIHMTFIYSCMKRNRRDLETCKLLFVCVMKVNGDHAEKGKQCSENSSLDTWLDIGTTQGWINDYRNLNLWMNYFLNFQVWIQTILTHSSWLAQLHAPDPFVLLQKILNQNLVFSWHRHGPLCRFGLDDRGLNLRDEGPKWIKMYVFT